MLGSATVTIAQQGNGQVASVENTTLFIGEAPSNQNTVVSINQQSDLDDLFGAADSVLKTNVEAAMLNANADFKAWAVPLAVGGDWAAAVDLAMTEGISPEFIAVTSPFAAKADVEAAQAKAAEVLNTYKRWVIFLAAIPTIDSGLQTWATYNSAMQAINDGVAAKAVMTVPQLHGNNLGIMAGRLCHTGQSIADSPMRVKTGAVVGLGNAPVDSAGAKLTGAILATLHDNRFTVTHEHEGYAGTYFSDGTLLDVPGGDFQVVENLRVLHAAARRIQVMATGDIADRKINSTPASMAAATTRYMGILSQMAIANGDQPGEVQPPQDGDVTLVWKDANTLDIYFKVRLYNSPKVISGFISLTKEGV